MAVTSSREAKPQPCSQTQFLISKQTFLDLSQNFQMKLLPAGIAQVPQNSKFVTTEMARAPPVHGTCSPQGRASSSQSFLAHAVHPLNKASTENCLCHLGKSILSDVWIANFPEHPSFVVASRSAMQEFTNLMSSVKFHGQGFFYAGGIWKTALH